MARPPLAACAWACLPARHRSGRLAGVQGSDHGRWDVFLVGTAIYVGADLLMAFTGDAMYRTLRIERRDGFGARALWCSACRRSRASGCRRPAVAANSV